MVGRSPRCDNNYVKKGAWTWEEDQILIDYVLKNGQGKWKSLPELAGLNRCGKSCRLRWLNYLRPDIKRGNFPHQEQLIILHLHSIHGNKWSMMAANLPGRTDNEIKNFWNTHLKKKLIRRGIDPNTHKPISNLNLSLIHSQFLSTSNWDDLMMKNPWNNHSALTVQDQLVAKIQFLQNLSRHQATSLMIIPDNTEKNNNLQACLNDTQYKQGFTNNNNGRSDDPSVVAPIQFPFQGLSSSSSHQQIGGGPSSSPERSQAGFITETCFNNGDIQEISSNVVFEGLESLWNCEGSSSSSSTAYWEELLKQADEVQ